MDLNKLNDEKSLKILKTRAQILAAEENTIDTHEYRTLLIFCLQNEKYALFYDEIEKILPEQPITLLPDIDPLINKITYHNGEIWPIIDTKLLFKKNKSVNENNLNLILIKRKNQNLILLCSKIIKQESFDPNEKIVLFDNNNIICKEIITGIYKGDIALINIAALFNFCNNYFASMQ